MREYAANDEQNASAPGKHDAARADHEGRGVVAEETPESQAGTGDTQAA
jgi:hypothetical protein